MPIIPMNKGVENKEHIKLELDVQKKVLAVIVDELTSIQTATETIKRLSSSGYMSKHFTALKGVLMLMTAYESFVKSVFDENDAAFHEKDMAEIRQRITREILEDKFPDEVKRLNDLARNKKK